MQRNRVNLYWFYGTKILSTRLGEHKKTHKSYLNGKSHYVSSFEVLEGGNFDIILLENYYCKDKYELKAKERHYIETIKCVNKYIPNRTNKEYRDTNKDYLKEYRSTYYENNKDKKIKKPQDNIKKQIKIL